MAFKACALFDNSIILAVPRVLDANSSYLDTVCDADPDHHMTAH